MDDEEYRKKTEKELLDRKRKDLSRHSGKAVPASFMQEYKQMLG